MTTKRIETFHIFFCNEWRCAIMTEVNHKEFYELQTLFWQKASELGDSEYEFQYFVDEVQEHNFNVSTEEMFNFLHDTLMAIEFEE